jgi:hypothetical protein
LGWKCRAYGWALRALPLTIRVTIHWAAIVDPCARGKPIVRGAADRAKRAAKEDRHGMESSTLNIDARRDRLSRLKAAGHDFTHHALRIILGTLGSIRRS